MTRTLDIEPHIIERQRERDRPRPRPYVPLQAPMREPVTVPPDDCAPGRGVDIVEISPDDDAIQI